MQVIDPSIFKAYDIRGVAGENLTADVVEKIGRFSDPWRWKAVWGRSALDATAGFPALS